MQSLFGKIRFMSRLRVDNLKNVDLRTVCFESKFLSNLDNQAPRFDQLHSSSAFFLIVDKEAVEDVKSKLPHLSTHKIRFFQLHFAEPLNISMAKSFPSSVTLLKCGRSEEIEKQKPIFDPHKIDSKVVEEMAYDALVWSSLRGLLVGDRNSKRSGTIPGVGLVHAPISLLPPIS
ncbi:uncharacterized protein [Henckelia pumila]|uniref:uncharacterized protein n=1 Tax=Henckelia pumila TaxID=405737 RepID=UPI003C6E3821